MYGSILSRGFTDGFRNLKLFLYRRYLTKSYTFHSKVPSTNSFVFKQNDFSQWKAYKDHSNDWRSAFFRNALIFCFGFIVGDFITSIFVNQKYQYYWYLTRPKLMRKFDQIAYHPDTQKWWKVVQNFWVKDYVELRKFWSDVHQLLFDEEEKVRKFDDKILKLREEIEEIDKKYPMTKNDDMF